MATNIKVKGGGDYYLISRTLGVEFGGAIGIVLFLADSVSIAFYAVGFAEAVHAIVPAGERLSVPIIAALAVGFLFIFAWLGADWATRLQYTIMIVVAAALLSFFYGGFLHWDRGLFAQNWSGSGPDLGFWMLFVIFFPAITGFTQGVNMSGDLKDPGKSLLLGTLSAVGLSLLIYFGAAVLFAGSLPGSTLIGDYHAMKRVATIGWLIDAGLIAGTLSSAMASFLGAPRILQSLAGDRIFPWFMPFALGVGPSANPRRAVLLSGAIAMVTITLGNLNFIAAVVSMFFLITYGLLNYATFYEARAASPSFRPRYRFFHARLSLVGALASLGAMIAIDPMAGAVAVAVLFGIYQYLKRTAGPARWADSQYSYHFHRIRENLLAMADKPEHPRGWRPCILAFCDDPVRREQLLRFASWIEGDSGLTTAVQIVEGEGAQNIQLRDKAELELTNFIAERELNIFALAVVAPDFGVGVETLLQSFGVGKIRANMVLLSKVDQLTMAQAENGEHIRYGRQLHDALRLGCNVVVLDAQAEEWVAVNDAPADQRRIDVWWWGGRNSHLSLLLAYLMTRSEAWNEAQIHVLAPSSKEAEAKTLESLKQTLEEVRIEATPEAVSDVDLEKVVERSAHSSVVFFPLRFREQQLLGALDQDVERLLDLLPVVALVAASEPIDLTAGPEEGEAAEQAAILDALTDSEEKAAEAERQATALAEAAAAKLRALKALQASAADGERLRAAGEAHEEAEKLAQEADERAQTLRAQARAAAEAAQENAKGGPSKGTPSEATQRPTSREIDLLAASLIGLTFGAKFGWMARTTAGWFLLAAVGLASFFRLERHVEKALVEVAMFKRQMLARALAAAVAGIAFYSRLGIDSKLWVASAALAGAQQFAFACLVPVG